MPWMLGLAALAGPMEPRDTDEDGVPDALIAIDDIPWAFMGPPAPSVVWDGSQYVMVFHARMTQDAIDALEDADALAPGVRACSSILSFSWSTTPTTCGFERGRDRTQARTRSPMPARRTASGSRSPPSQPTRTRSASSALRSSCATWAATRSRSCGG